MSRHRTHHGARHRTGAIGADLASAARLLAVAALAVSLAGLAVPHAADAAPLRVPHAPAKASAAEQAKAKAKAGARGKAGAREKAGAKAKPRPGPRGYQMARDSRAEARQYGSGIGRDIQNLNGVSTPSLLSGPQSTTVTSAGHITSQGAYCAPGGTSCDISQNMW
ncbi:MAG: hypothetical protein IRZ07_02815 [Microbispora sp.]|nr:hypothetical protein [Microbispora sp.]